MTAKPRCVTCGRTLPELKVDPERIGVMGGSAGGHLTGLLAMTNGKPEFEGKGSNPEQSSKVQAAIVMAATMDLVASNKEKTGEGTIAFFGATAAENPTLYAQVSPITHVRPGVPRSFSSRERRTP